MVVKVSGSKALRIYVGLVSAVSIIGLLYVYLLPPASMQVNRDGLAHLTPKVEHPETGEAIDLGTLIRHFRGD